MTSTFSIYNNTRENVWVSYGVHKAAMYGAIAGALTVVTAGAAVAITGSGAAAIGVSTVGTFLSSTSGFAGQLDVNTRKKFDSDRKKLKDVMKRDGYELVKPGKRYKSGNLTLSLCLTGFVVRNNGQVKTCTVWTGPTSGSDNQYKVTEYF